MNIKRENEALNEQSSGNPLVDCLMHCRRQYFMYAKEHREKAERFKAEAADNRKSFNEQREIMALARAAQTKEGVNLMFVAAIDEALKEWHDNRPDAAIAIGEEAFKAGWHEALITVAPGTGEHEAEREVAWSEYEPSEAVKALS